MRYVLLVITRLPLGIVSILAQQNGVYESQPGGLDLEVHCFSCGRLSLPSHLGPVCLLCEYKSIVIHIFMPFVPILALIRS